MLHELLLALTGYSGDVFVARDNAFVVATDLDFISEQECEVLNRLGRLGWAYHECMQFIRQHRENNRSLDSRKQCEDTSFHGVYADAFCEGLDRAFDDYRRRLEKLEVGLMPATVASTIYPSDTPFVESASTFTVRTITDVMSIMTDYEIVFPAILTLLQEIRTHPREWHGVQLVEQLRTRYRESGIPLLRNFYGQLTMMTTRVLWRQITAWLIYGLLRDPFNEFFIQPKEVQDRVNEDATSSSEQLLYEPIWRRKHRLVLASVPSWIGGLTAEDILFTGQIVLAVQERGHHVPEEWTQKWLQELHSLSKDMSSSNNSSSSKSDNILQSPMQLKINADAFTRLVHTARRDLSEWLWRTAVLQYHAADQLEAFRNYYLLGRGDFYDSLLDNIGTHRSGITASSSNTSSTPLSKLSSAGNSSSSKPSSTGTTVRDRELRSLWSRAAGNTSAEDDRCFPQFRLERASDLADADIFGTPVRLHYHLEWPFDLVVAPAELARYDTVFLCLLAVRNAQRRLQRTNWRARSRGGNISREQSESLRHLWHLRNSMQCFVDQIWAHMQMDVIEVHFQRLCHQIQDVAINLALQNTNTLHHHHRNTNTRDMSNKEHDFTSLQLAHTRFLDAICKGCFVSMPAVFTAIRTAVRCCTQLALLMERYQEIPITKTWSLDVNALKGLEQEFMKNAAFVFRTLSGVSRMPTSSATIGGSTGSSRSTDASSIPSNSRDISIEVDARRHLDQLLLRLDYNQWYSIGLTSGSDNKNQLE